MSHRQFVNLVLFLSLIACLVVGGDGRVYAQDPTNNPNALDNGNKIYLPLVSNAQTPQAQLLTLSNPTATGAQDGFSMSIMSDPQLTWWRGGNDPDCKSEECENGKADETNSKTVIALNRLNDPALNLHWPITPTITKGAGAPILAPVGTIINGDLTGFWHFVDALLFMMHYNQNLLKEPIYPGLGNHDYENNVVNCYYINIYYPDNNRCAKEAVWWMANQIEHAIPNLVSKDLSGYVAVKNSGGFEARFSVAYDLNGETHTEHSGNYPVAQWRKVLIPREATNIQVKLEENTGLLDGLNQRWDTVKEFGLAGPQAICYELSGTTLNPDSAEINCPKEWPSGSNGSLAYSYDVGNYHFVQLQNRPNYAVNLPDVITVDKVLTFGITESPGFEVTTSYDWLRKDLQAATAAGKSIVLNMHNARGSMGNLQQFDKNNPFGVTHDEKQDSYYYDISQDDTFKNVIKNQNVVAIFAGHLHQHYGQLYDNYTEQPILMYNGVYTIPIILSGSVECQTILLAEFHRKYFNVGVIKPSNSPLAFVTNSHDICDERDLKDDKGKSLHYNENSGNTAPRTFFINKPPQVTAALETTPALEGAALAFHAVGVDPDGDPLTYAWSFGDDETGAGATPTHIYRDNGVYQVTVTVDDGYQGTATASFVVTVSNVAPTITVAGATIAENDIATLTGSIIDPGVLDSFTLVVNWGEGNPETIQLSAGTQTYNISHQYRDDNPTGTPSDVYPVQITVTDKDNGVGAASTTVTVQNVNPQTQIDQILDQAGETVGEADIILSGLPITVTTSYSDVGALDTRTAVIAWNDGTPLLNLGEVGTTTTVTHTYTISNVYTVAVTVTDDDTGIGAASRVVYVVPPTDAVRRAIDDLEKVHSKVRDAETKIRAAIETLRGRDGQSRPENVLDRLNAADRLNALELLEQTIHRLDLAEQVDTTLNFRRVKSLLTLTAKAIVVEAITQAETNAATQPHRGQFAAAQSIMEEGQMLLNNHQYVPAIDKFSHALIRL